MYSRGAWLSWLERTVHIREVVGSSPSAPTSPLRLAFSPASFFTRPGLLRNNPG